MVNLKSKTLKKWSLRKKGATMKAVKRIFQKRSKSNLRVKRLSGNKFHKKNKSGPKRPLCVLRLEMSQNL